MAKAVVSFLETLKPAIPRIRKLYGQIKPNIQSGGCQEGAFSWRYQLSPVFTQSPEPMA